MKTAIVYYSRHHENTRKLLDVICARYDITLIDAAKTQSADLSSYDLIGFASGIYYSKFHKSVLQFAQNNLPMHKRVFFLYTYGAEKEGYTKSIETVAAKKEAVISGTFGCFGFNTFGPFKLIGGIAKGHPNQEDFDNVLRFYENIIH